MITVSGVALVYDEAFAARVGGEPYEGGAEDPGSYNNVVIWFTLFYLVTENIIEGV